ncbi:glycosyltransferase [Tengunoibacter tsumagoiensis]|uniref:Glycosyl transferase family 1 n=1 Tax=Tengunoibacter tsumagoiensis TaxID=2014871 RepID=A0A401ZZV9_9CHLR|nr:glycosyltransferase [Tengunoibacter tsumagoiensis]GCE12427.1 glycosyl transferase family 1 [Tengunoibacter tsumagoiensis]
MNITIIAIGSRGDIAPYIALSQGLINAGHTICLATHQAYAELVRSYHIPFFPLDDDAKDLFQEEGGEQLLAKGINPYRFAQHVAHRIAHFTPQYMQRAQEACRESDTVIVALASLLIGSTIAEKYQKRLIITILQPMLLSTAALPEPTSPWLPQKPPLLGKTMNLFSHMMAQYYTGWLFLPAANAARKKLYSLPPLPRSFYATLPNLTPLLLCAYSPLLVPKPTDWSETIHITGFWMTKHPESWQPDNELIDFLSTGPAPIYIGFGSMSPYHPLQTIEMVEETLTQIGQRGILLVDKYIYKTQKRSDRLYLINDVAHDWLFPRMQAIVHHGGAGTTAASLSAGVPTIVIPHISDQWFWGERVVQLGAGPQPISRKHLTSQKLAEHLHSVLHNQKMRQKAREIGNRLQNEDGVDQAVKAINALENDKSQTL